MKFIILEYGMAYGTSNPTNFNPYTGVNEKYREIILPKGYHNDVSIPWSVRSSQHMNSIYGVIKHWAKYPFEVVSLPFMNAERWLKDNYKDVAVVSMSVGGFFNSQFLEKYKNDIYFVQASGNEGNMGEGMGAHNSWNGAVVGAVNERFEPEWYSSWGKGKTTHAGIVLDTLEWTNGYVTVNKPFRGTSESTPQHATQVMNMICSFKEKYGRRPRVDEILATVKKYTKDIFESGKDLRTGYGYYEYKEGELCMTFKDADKIAPWAASAINKAAVLGILKGNAKGNVLPREPVSLERLMVILNRVGVLGK